MGMKIQSTQVVAAMAQADASSTAGASGGGAAPSPVQAPAKAPVQETTTAGSSGGGPVAQAKSAALLVEVPKGQLDRTRKKIPKGWSSAGNHNGFKPAIASIVPDGFFLKAVNHSDIPRGRR